MADDARRTPDAPAASLVPAELARRFRAVPISVVEGEILLAAETSDVPGLVAAVEAVTGRRARVVVAPFESIEAEQHRLYGPPPSVRAGRFEPPHAPPETDVGFLRRLAESAGIEFAPLDDFRAEIARSTARLLPERIARRYGVVCLSASGGELRLATAHPHEEASLALVEALTALRVVPVAAPAHRIPAAIDHAYAAVATHQPMGVPQVDIRAFHPSRRLGELLVASGALDRRTLATALSHQRRTGERLGRLLVSMGAVGPDRIAAAIGAQLRIPHVLAGDVHPTRAARDLLPQALCRRHLLVPLELAGDVLVVAMADPLDGEAGRALRAARPHPVRIVVAAEAAVADAVEKLYADEIVDASTRDLIRRQPEESAHHVLSRGQAVTGIVLAAIVALGLALALTATLIALVVVSVLFYLSTSVYKFALVYSTFGHEPELPVSDLEVALLDERLLPRYTILVPLYREAVMTTQLIAALERLDYPRAKLDIKLLLEEDDIDTIRSVRAADLGPHYDVMIVPDAQPKTKPKACNYGLLHARGEYVVIYDAEDAPEPDQLKKAVVAYRKAPAGVACVQAKLNYWNRDQNLLTRWFTTEYSMWFDLFLPGLDATGAPIPLGGTSNHFRLDTLLELGAWDPYNVTEDADVGIRLSRRGYRTTMIDSTTYEEANSRTYNWIRQRSRWVKGYIQTWLVHMRHPVRLWQELGGRNFVSFQLVVGGTALTMLLNPVFWGLTSLWAATEAGLIREMFPGVVYFAGALNLFVGNFVFTYLNVAGSLRRGYHDLVKYALFSPLYWALMSVAAWRGLAQLITRPSYWEKTIHGLTTNGR